MTQESANDAGTMMDAEVIGTDPQRVLNSTQARYDPSKLLGAPSEKVNLTEGLLAVTVATKNWYYDQMASVLPYPSRMGWICRMFS